MKLPKGELSLIPVRQEGDVDGGMEYLCMLDDRNRQLHLAILHPCIITIRTSR